MISGWADDPILLWNSKNGVMGSFKIARSAWYLKKIITIRTFQGQEFYMDVSSIAGLIELPWSSPISNPLYKYKGLT